jgi:hypothetical protein
MRARVVAVVAVLVAVATVAVAAWVRTLPNVTTQLLTGYGTDLPAGLLAVAWTATGAVLVALRPRNALGWLVVGSGSARGCSAGRLRRLRRRYRRLAAGPLGRLGGERGCGLPGLLPLASLLLALYPDGRLPARWWRWPFAATAVGIALLTLAMMLAPQAYADVAPGPAPLRAPTLALAGLSVGGALFVGGTIVIWVASVVRLLRARAPERQQLAWLFVVVVPFLLVAFLTSSMPGFLALGFLIPVAVAVGVLRYRLLGIETVLRRGLVYALLTAAVVAVYLVVTTVAGAQLDRGPLAGAVAAALGGGRVDPAMRPAAGGGGPAGIRRPRRPGCAPSPARATGSRQPGERPAPGVLATVTDAVHALGAAVLAPTGRC